MHRHTYKHSHVYMKMHTLHMTIVMTKIDSLCGGESRPDITISLVMHTFLPLLCMLLVICQVHLLSRRLLLT